MKHEIWLANGILILHTLVVGITVAGGVALFTGRFAKFHKKDYFAWVFLVCTFGQIASLQFSGGCIFTKWERDIRLHADPTASYSMTFLEQYLPFLPESIIHAVPLLTLGGLAGAILQIRYAVKRKKLTNDNPTQY